MRIPWFTLVLVMLMWVFGITSVSAAMDPAEIKRIHDEAPYRVSGQVVSDELFHDITEEEDHPRQLRKMALEITEVLKSDETIPDMIEIYYHYIPAWQEFKYVGGKWVDVAVDDVITVWLTEGPHGFELILGGYSMEHVFYAQDRPEHIPEPFWHLVVRKLSNVNLDFLVLGGILIVLIWAGIYGLRRRKI